MDNLTFSTNYKHVPVSVKPEKSGYYLTELGKVYYSSRKQNFIVRRPTHYLQPVEDSVVLTREELDAVRLEGYRDGYRQCQDDEREGNEP